MIKIEFYTNQDGRIYGFFIYGHSEYDEIGKDIVCSAVSSAMYMVINTITDVINCQADIVIKDNGEARLLLDEKGIILCNDIILGFKLHVISLESMYPKNIKVNYVEV